MSILSYLAGQDKNTAGQAAYAAATNAYGNVGNIANAFGGLGASAATQYTPDNAAYRSALTNEVNDLRQDPWTTAYGTAQVARQTQGTDAAFQHMNADVMARAAGNNLSPDSSVVRGGLQANDIWRAGQIGNAQRDVANNAVNSRLQRGQQILNLLGVQANADYGRMTNAYQTEAQLNNGLGNTYQGIGNAQHEAEAQRQGAFLSMLTGAAGIAGNVYGMKHSPYAGGQNGYGYGNVGSYVPTGNNVANTPDNIDWSTFTGF